MAVPKRPTFLPALVLEVTPLVPASKNKSNERNPYPFSISTIRNYLLAKSRTSWGGGASFGVREHNVVWASVSGRPTKEASEEEPVAIHSGYLVDNKPLLHELPAVEQTTPPIVGLPADDPSQSYHVPCTVQVFVSTEMKLEEQNAMVSITHETIFHLLPPVSLTPGIAADTTTRGITELKTSLESCQLLECKLRTECHTDALHAEYVQSCVSRRELKHRIESQLSRLVGVGTSRSTA